MRLATFGPSYINTEQRNYTSSELWTPDGPAISANLVFRDGKGNDHSRATLFRL